MGAAGLAGLLALWVSADPVHATGRTAMLQTTPLSESYSITTGREFLDIVNSWVDSAAATYTTITLLQNISFAGQQELMRDWGTRNLSGPGSLTIQGPGGGRTAILDAASMGPITPPIDQAAHSIPRTYIRDIVLVNLCEGFLYRLAGGSLSYREAIELSGFIPRALPTQILTRLVHNMTDGVIYTRTADVARLLGVAILQRSQPFPAIFRDWSQLVPEPTFEFLIGPTGSYFVDLVAFANPAAATTNLTVQSSLDPTDPLLVEMRVNGTWLPPTYCGGEVIPKDLLEVDFVPLWLAQGSESTIEKLILSANATLRFTSYIVHSAVHISANASLAGLVGTPVVFPLRTHLSGPFFDVPSVQPVFLDLAGAPGLLVFSPGAQLYVTRLVLTGLAVQPLPSSLDNSTATALPMWGFTLQPGSTGVMSADISGVFMDDVTWEVPLSDYALLLAAELARQQGCSLPTVTAGSSGLQPGQAAVLAGVQRMMVTSVDALWRSFVMSDYTGYGVVATKVLVQPLSLDADTLQLIQQAVHTNLGACGGRAAPPPDNRHAAQTISNQSGMRLGLGLGLGLGVGLLCLAAACALFLYVRQKQGCTIEALDLSSSPSALKLAQQLKDSCTPTAMPALLSAHHSVPGQFSKSIAASLDHSTSADSFSRRSPGSQPRVSSPSTSVLGLAGFLESRMASLISDYRTSPKPGESAADSADSQIESATASTCPAETMHLAVAAKSAILRVDVANQVSIIKPLGQGGSATVFLGRWRGLICAVKVINVHDTQRPDRPGPSPWDRAIMEAAVAASVGHRHVLATYHYDIKPMQEVVSQEGLQVEMANKTTADMFQLVLVQELCAMSLDQCLATGGLHSATSGLPLMDLILPIMLHISSGLEHLHLKKIVHGDIKPGNVLMQYAPDRSECPFQAKLADFGMAGVMDVNSSHLSFCTGGTPLYIAPEVVQHGHMSPAADIFSLGVLYWELLHNRLPVRALWTEGAPPSTTSSALDAPPVDLEQLPKASELLFPAFAPFIPAALAELCGRCLAANPRSRPDVHTVFHELREVCMANHIPIGPKS